MPHQLAPKAPPHRREYMESTLFNLQHESEAQFDKRAAAFMKFIPAERSILQQTAAALDDNTFQSTEFKQSSWMVHVQRGDFVRMEIDAAARDRTAAAYRDYDLSVIGNFNVTTGNLKMMEMIVRGEEGPLSAEQMKYGAEIATTGHDLARLGLEVQERVELNQREVHPKREQDEEGRISHPKHSKYGVDLSSDPGTIMRDSLDLPIMTGTSGSVSRMVLSHLHASRQQGVSSAAPGLTDDQSALAIKNLGFDFMRRGATARALMRLINANRQRSGSQPKTVSLDMVQTHTYPEVSAAVDLTLNESMGETAEEFRESSEEAARRLAAELARLE
jgi:hypothetical protein